MGAEDLCISGGEPTLYKHLVELIATASGLGLRVSMNSNGSPIRLDFAKELIRAGLGRITISLYSHVPQVHNKIRRSKKLWSSACNTVRMFADLKKEYPDFQLWTQAIILRENFRSFDELIRFHYGLGSERINISYLEGDFEGKLLLSAEEIRHFRGAVLPRIIAFFGTLDPSIAGDAVAKAERLYHPESGSPEEFSEGVYWHGKSCSIPRRQADVMANGDIHPCNFIDYIHAPIMGNLFQQSFREIWTSDGWQEFRQSRIPECRACPMNLHMSIPLRPREIGRSLKTRILSRLSNFNKAVEVPVTRDSYSPP
jgi:MoaA/NifB/PqqE/SkfB family radical SAM enzyme